MTQPERWQQISQIFESALALEPEKRVAYLRDRCAGDESLRREVELLIESHRRADEENFINSPAVERGAPLLVSEDSEAEVRADRLEKGQEISHYVVVDKLGSGGMGEVYLARDTHLDRTVALKILPEELASDKRRMQRFKQEARIASALNQPNILTIFEFGEFDSLSFMVTEYVDGETLRQHMRHGQMKLGQIIDVSVQILAALDAAHDAKIVHRDIKPENIMIRRRDKIIKVLDFGLAKLTETVSVADSRVATEMLVKTMPGSVLGTVNYMSPEQAQGLPVDGRTDIWSTGVVLYEMAAGRSPFKGPTHSHTTVEILEKEPSALAHSAKIKVPPELERIVNKSLAKNPDERYQTAKDMLIDLRNLRRQLDVDAQLERSASAEALSRTGATDAEANLTARQVSGLKGEHERQTPRKKIVLGISLTAVLAVVALVIGVTVSRSSRSRIVVSSPAPVSQRMLNYWMMVQKYRDGKPYEEPFRLASEINFEKDYRVRLNIHSPQSGYLYILNEGPSGANSLSVLFPSSTANNGSAFLAANRQVQIPQQTWFQFDQEEGTEKLWLVWSANSIAELEAVKGFANPKDKGMIPDPNLTKNVKEFLETHSISKTSVEKNDDQKETSIKAPGDLIAHVIKLEHH